MMFVTVEKARKNWCPHARLAMQNTDKVFNRVWVSENKDTKKEAYLWKGNGVGCVADECMAWRWAQGSKLRDIDLVTGDVEKEDRVGYCGLSGVPQQGD